jgi:hypothetical protein
MLLGREVVVVTSRAEMWRLAKVFQQALGLPKIRGPELDALASLPYLTGVDCGRSAEGACVRWLPAGSAEETTSAHAERIKLEHRLQHTFDDPALRGMRC